MRIRTTDVQAWVKSMSKPTPTRAQGLAATTIRTRYNYVAMAFRAALADRIISVDPCASVKLPRARKPEHAMTVPTVEQVAAALEHADGWLGPFAAVCAFAGLRLGEAAGLQVDDIDFLRRSLHVQRQVQGSSVATTEITPPKFGSERVVHIPQGLVDILAAHVAATGTSSWLFDIAGERVNRNSASHRWRRVRTAAGLPDYTLHDLRHFYASGLIADGCDVVTVQRALGHSSANITLSVYAHLWPTAEDRTRAAAAGLMDAVLGGAADSSRTGRASAQVRESGQR